MTLVSVSRRQTVHLHVQVHRKKICGNTVNSLPHFSYTVSHVSHRLESQRLNLIQLHSSAFWVHCLYDLMLTFLCVTVIYIYIDFVLHLHYTVDFMLIPTVHLFIVIMDLLKMLQSLCALKLQIRGAQYARIILAYISILCLSKCQPLLIYFMD